MSDDRLTEIEQQLRVEAAIMLTSQAIPSKQLLAQYQRRKTRRKLICSTAVAFLFLAGLSMRGLVSTPEVTELEHQMVNFSPGADELPPLETPTQLTASATQTTDSVTTPASNGGEYMNGTPQPVAVFFVRHAEDGTEVIIPGIYVPGGLAPIAPERLTPIEKRAIQRVLGVKVPSNTSNKI